MRMTQFLIAVIVISLIMTAFGMILADANDKYTISSYDSTELEVFETLEENQALAEQIQNRVTNQTTDRGLTDIIGGFIADAKDTLTLSANSYDTFFTMSNAGLEKAKVPQIFSVAFFTIIIIIVFLGIILSAVLGRDL